MKKFYLMAILCVSCGSENYEAKNDIPGKPSVYTGANAKTDCFSSGCHNGNGVRIPTIGNGFKESKKVLARVLDGSMPPNQNGFDKKGFLAWINAEN